MCEKSLCVWRVCACVRACVRACVMASALTKIGVSTKSDAALSRSESISRESRALSFATFRMSARINHLGGVMAAPHNNESLLLLLLLCLREMKIDRERHPFFWQQT